MTTPRVSTSSRDLVGVTGPDDRGKDLAIEWLRQNRSAVVQDVKSNDEADIVRSRGAYIVHVSLSTDLIGDKVAPSARDIAIVNDGTVDELHYKLAKLFPAD